MRHKWLGSLVVCMLTLGAWASDGVAQEMELDTDDMAVTARYFGETLVHGGLTVGGEAYLIQGPVYKLVLAPNVGWYVHRNNHHGAFLNLESGGRWTADFGLFGDAFVGLGYFHRFPDADIYSVEDGDVDGQSNTGNPNLMGSGWVGGGWDLEKNDIAPVNVHLRVGGFVEWPFTADDVLLPHLAAQLGAAYKF